MAKDVVPWQDSQPVSPNWLACGSSGRWHELQAVAAEAVWSKRASVKDAVA
jgi:hypothetical protein